MAQRRSHRRDVQVGITQLRVSIFQSFLRSRFNDHCLAHQRLTVFLLAEESLNILPPLSRFFSFFAALSDNVSSALRAINCLVFAS